jgi:amino acid adenylation domain-containing protein
VPLLFEKSKLTTIALLGVIRAGAAFVLLDASQPVDRLKAICDDVRAEIVIASEEKTALATKLVPRVVTINDKKIAGWKAGRNFNEPQPTNVRPDTALYAVFTSGSTGKPKGVVTEHSAYCTSALVAGPAFGLNSESRVLQFASYAFDASITEHLVTLILGGCICIPSDLQRRGDLSALINELRCTWVGTTPSVAQLLDPSRVSSLKVLALGGEAVPSELIQTWCPHVHVVQGYGPAECAVAVSVNPLMSDHDPPNNIGHLTCGIGWVVDSADHNLLLELGKCGELVVQGPHVARGYIENENNVNSSFLEPPEWLHRHGSTSHGRLYKTGDIVQYNSNGSLRFIGRADNQVKINGQRVELGEIEHQLKKGLREQFTVVVEVVQRENGHSPVLLAFARRESQNGQQDPDQFPTKLFLPSSLEFQGEARAAQATMSALLPQYMLPSEIFLISHVPMTTTDKIDRRKIRAQAASLSPQEYRAYGALLSQSKHAPSSPEEKYILQIWASTLKLHPSQIGVEDNFFHLGGTSILAMNLAGMSQKRGFRNVSPTLIFTHPTIRAMAKEMERSISFMPSVKIPGSPKSHPNEFVVQSLQSHDAFKNKELINGPFPVTEFQHECLQGEPFYMTIHMPHVDQVRLEESWNLVQEKHSVLRSIYAQHKGAIYQGFVRHVPTSIPTLECGGRPPAEFAEELCKKDVLVRVPDGTLYWRVWRINGPDDSVLVLRIHHAQFDPVGLAVLLNDFVAAYEGHILKPARLDFPEYMALRLQHNNASPTMEFWRHFLKGSRILPLSDIGGYSAEAHDPYYLSKRLGTMAPPVGITISMVMRTAWALVLSHYSGHVDIVFGEVVHGRNFPIDGVSEVVGCTIGICPMRMQIEKEATAYDLLLESKRKYIERLPHEAVDMKYLMDNCTSWGSSRPTSILIGEESDNTPRITLEGKDCPHKHHYFNESDEEEMKELYVWLTDEGEGPTLGMHIPRAAGMSPARGDDFIGKMVQTMERLSAFPDLPWREIIC